MLEVRNLTKTFGGPAGRRVLDGVALTVQPGEYIAIVGESGVGKSTLLNLIAGLDVPDAGEVLLEGRDLARMDENERTLVRRSRMGFVFQAFHLLPHLSIARNVGLPLALNGRAGPEADRRVTELLEAVGLADRADSLPRELSGGEMQRVAVARALVHRPALVLADEPTGNLDPDNAAMILEILRAQIKRDRAAGVLVTHSANAAATTDRIYELTRAGLRERPRARGAQRERGGDSRLGARLALLDAAALGPLRQGPGRTIIAVIAIALGVALGFSVYLINRVAADEVELASRSLFGMADLSVRAPGPGFDERLYPKIARVPRRRGRESGRGGIGAHSGTGSGR